jgi:ribose transport system substrate-binding protein
MFALFITIISVSYLTSNDKKYKIIFISKALDKFTPFWGTMQQGMYAAEKEYGVELEIVGVEDETQVEKQKILLTEAIESKPDAIILCAASYTQLDSICDNINGPVLITVDSDIQSPKRLGYIGTNNYEAGRELGRILSSKVSESDKILFISSIEGTSSIMERERGFMSSLTGKQKGQIVGPFYCETIVEKSYEISKKALAENPSIKWVIGMNEPSVTGSVLAINELTAESGISVLGIDTSKTVIKGLEYGVVDTVLVQKPFNMGYQSIKYAVDAIKGEKLEAHIDTGFQVVNKGNMYSKENQKLLFIFAD